ncbi:unnamed protein product, partial [Ectocarpus fasciculatus]
VHADYLNVTVPEDRASEVHNGVLRHLTMLGAIPDTADLYRLNYGTYKATHRQGFSTFGFSGGLLGALRQNSMLDPVLHQIGCGPHRVTRLDVAHDLSENAAPWLQRLHRRAKQGNVRLTRKAVSPERVRFIESHNYPDPSVKTGSLYLGARSAEVRALVYDKRCERISK